MCEIKNTVRFSFSDGSEKPNMGEIANFVKALDVDHGQVEAAYRIAEEKSLFVKFKSEDSMLHALSFNSEDLVFHYANGKEAKVCMSHAGEYIQYVRVYDLPPEVSDHEVAVILGKYGTVKRVVREKFPAELSFDVHTGVRGLYMDVKKEIPTSLHFLNRKGNIFYPGNKDKCFHCKADGHRMNSCPKRKTRRGQQMDKRNENSSGTYAGVVAEGASQVNTAQTEKVKEVLEEIEVEMDIAASISEESSEEQANGNDDQKAKPMYKYINEDIYKKAKELWRIQQNREAEERKNSGKNSVERKKLQARVKTAAKYFK